MLYNKHVVAKLTLAQAQNNCIGVQKLKGTLEQSLNS